MPTIKVSREQWLARADGLISDGYNPSEWTINSLRELMGVTKGSFYSHFPGGVRELDAALIERWLNDNPAKALNSSLAPRDPAERLRKLWDQCMRTAKRDGAMRRWAAGEPAAAAAVSAVDKQLTEYARGAFTELGFGATESAVLAATLVSTFAGTYHAAPQPPPADAAAFETLLGVLTRAAAVQALARGDQEVQAAPGAEADEVVLMVVPRGLTEQALATLRDQAAQFAAQAAGDTTQERPVRRSSRRRGTT